MHRKHSFKYLEDLRINSTYHKARFENTQRDSSVLLNEAVNFWNYTAYDVEEWKNGVRVWSNGEMTLTGKTEVLRA